MSELGGLRKHQNNPACTKSVSLQSVETDGHYNYGRRRRLRKRQNNPACTKSVCLESVETDGHYNYGWRRLRKYQNNPACTRSVCLESVETDGHYNYGWRRLRKYQNNPACTKSVSLQSVETDGHYNYGKRRRWELYTLHKTSLFSCKILHRTFPNNGQMKIGWQPQKKNKCGRGIKLTEEFVSNHRSMFA